MVRWRQHSGTAMVVVGGVLVRWWVLSTPTGRLNADEAVTGLGAIDALHGRFDVVIPGNAYTANLESYVFAPIVAIFGPRVTLLKLMAVCLWALACVLVYRLGRLIDDRPRSGLGAMLLWLVPGALMVLSTSAYLAYPGGLVLVAATLTRLAREVECDVASTRRSLAVGLLAGVAVFAHPMYLAIVVPGLTVVAVHHWRDLRRWWLPAALGGLAANAPWLMWNMWHGFPSLRSQVEARSTTYLGRLTGFFTGLLPRDFGLLGADDNRWTIGRPMGIALYLVILGVIAVGGLRLWRRSAAGRLVAITLVAVWPAMAAFSPLGFVRDGRYGVVPAAPMFVALGFGVMTLIEAAGRRRPAIGKVAVADSPSNVGTAAAWATIIGVWCGLLIVPYLVQFVGTDLSDPNEHESSLVNWLEARDVRFVAGSYWVVLPLTYLSDARIVSAVTGNYPVRYPHYQQAVERADPAAVAFVYRLDDDDPASLRMPVDRYERLNVAGYIVYLPRRTA